MSFGQLSHLELGRRAPSPAHVETLAAALSLGPPEHRHWLVLAGLAHVPPGLREAVAAAVDQADRRTTPTA
jgi:hypothetical protein